MYRRKKYLLIALCLFIAERAFSQCCTLGDPFISDAEQPALQSKILTASLAYRYSHSGKYYSDDSRFTELPFQEIAYSNYTELQVGYGITNWLTVMTDLGYFFNKTLTTPGIDSYKGYGLGDLGLYAKFNAFSSSRLKLTLSPTIGVKFPTGVFDQEVDNVQLPISVQPSAGSYCYLANLFVSKGFRKIALAGFASYEYSQLIQSENFYYKYGDQWIAALYFNYRPWKRVTIDLQVRNEYRSKSNRENEEIVEASGYEVVFFTPQLSYAFKHDWYVSAYADIPMYKYYNGIQMSFGYALSFRVTKKIDFIALKARHSANQSNKSELGVNMELSNELKQ
ncbi:MAG TPA: hypothetical protein PKN44_15425 [Bacteroidales bacterium]|nr:hypothetical protein [Bacteroidales bacterium]